MKAGRAVRRLGLVAAWAGLAACGPHFTPPNQDAIDQLYAGYDRDFSIYLANAVAAVGKETIRVEPLSGRYPVPKKITVSGTAYEVGATIGHIARQCNRSLPLRTEATRARSEAIVAMYRRIHPPYLETVRGVADAHGIALDQVDMAALEYDYFVSLWWSLLKYDQFASLTDFATYGDVAPRTGCSVASFFTGRSQIVGRNFDNPSDRPHYFARLRVAGTFASLGHVIYSPTHWAVDGINEKGLSVNCATNLEEYAWQEAYPGEPAVFSGHLARIVMDTCATVEEALGLIDSVRVWFPNEGLHWLIADASGKSVVVEFDLGRRMVVLDRPGPYELMTNTALQKGEDYVASRCPRYRRGRELLAAGTINDMDGMHAVMWQLRPTSGEARTLWTSVMDLNRRSFLVVYRMEPEQRYELVF